MVKKRYGNIVERLQMIIVFALFALRLIPQLQYTYAGVTWSLLYQVVFIFWVLTTMIRSGAWFLILKSYYMHVFLWLTVLVIEFILFPNTQIGFLGLNLTFWEPMIIYYYYTEIADDTKTIGYLSVAAAGMLLYGIVQSIQSVNVNMLAAREASSGHSSVDAVLTGNYSFTATLTILIPLCFGLLFTKQKTVIKMAAGLFIALSAYFIFHCNLMISVVCLVFSFFSILIFSQDNGLNVRRVFIVFAAVLAFVLTAFFWKQVTLSLLEAFRVWINNREMDARVNQLKHLINGSMVGNVSSRFDLDLIALRTFIHNPIIGIGPQNNAKIYFLKQLGMHATFFDDLARYGVFGCYVMFSAYWAFLKHQVVTLNHTMGAKVYKASFLMFVIISMLNPTMSANVGIALFFIIPAVNRLLFNNSENSMEVYHDHINKSV